MSQEDVSRSGLVSSLEGPGQPKPNNEGSNEANRSYDANGDTNNDEDDECSSGDDSSSEEDEDNDEEQDQRPSLAEIRAQKIRRNQEMLERLGLVNHNLLGGLAEKPRKTKKQTKPLAARLRRGMILPPSSPTFGREFLDRSRLEPPLDLSSSGTRGGGAAADDDEKRLYAKYPHREAQIRKLLGLLRPHSPLGSDEGGGAPAPIFVTGPPGCGKTGVVRDVIQTLCLSHELPWAYADCAHLDVPALGEVTRTLYRQLRESSRQQQHGGFDRTGELDQDNHNSTDKDDEARANPRDRANRKRKALDDPDKATSSSTEPRKRSPTHIDGRHLDEVNHNLVNGKTQTGHDPPRSGRKKAPPKRNADSSSGPWTATSTTVSQTTAAAKFSRDLLGLFPSSARSCGGGLIVLDRADRLLSLPQVGQMEQPNFLAQLLMVPRTAGLRITVVAISASHLLERSRINPLQSTIAGTAQPICIRFTAYNTKAMLKDVLRQDHVQVLMTGSPRCSASDGGSSPFRQSALESFIDTLVQSMQNTTTNIKAIVQVGRRLWPQYIEPLSRPDFIRATLRSARENLVEDHHPLPPPSSSTLQSPPKKLTLAALQREVLSILDRKLRPTLVAATGCGMMSLGTVRRQMKLDPDSHTSLPPLAKYMLLSAFLCQVNRPERDRQLFSIERNGKRGRTEMEHRSGGGRTATDQESAGANSLQLPRPRAFALERMLSVYSSVMGLLCDELPFSSSSRDGDGVARTLGGSAFYDNLAILSDAGLIHEYPNRSPYELFRLSETRYWTSLTHDEAKAMARSMNFPLDSYIF